MTTAVKPIQEYMQTLTPHLICAGAAEAIDYDKRAFGATEVDRMQGPGGKLMHAMLRIGDSPLMLADENPQWSALGPKTLGGSPVTIHLCVVDVDAVFERAVKEGGTAKMPPADMFLGDRYGVLTDPWGHNWSIATHVKDVTPEQLQTAVVKMGGCPGDAK